ncbi:MAG TPA: twin-arginine translocase TatA/TatE family subunit [bacterium]|nr:twin-arginine translocase TatA/TatE family subunit [bacterium]
MFDNPEKLFIILVIALLVLGPQKLMGLGGSLRKTIRDFRGSIRDAQDSFHDAMDEASRPEDSFEAPALPAPDPSAPAMGFPETPVPAAPSDAHPADAVSEDEGRDSLASEPSAQAVQELLQRKE